MSILLTGGCGFIGSHTAVELIQKGHHVIIVDNLSNSNKNVVDKIKEITGITPVFYERDITSDLDDVFESYYIRTVIHFAAYKAVGESVLDPLKYYSNNIVGLISLLTCMEKHNVNRIIFSSSATVYGNPTSLPLTESSPLSCLNPYGRTKLFGEEIIRDVVRANLKIQATILRYFNPVGAHESGLIGESPLGVPRNLFPYIIDVIKGKRPHLNIYGVDYDTIDGTGVRDYIHVVDLALGHVAALNKMSDSEIDGTKIYNLGTGKGYSVLEIVKAFNKSSQYEIPFMMTDRREGDSPEVYADCSLAKEELGWVATRNLNDMVKDSLNYTFQESTVN